MNGYGDRDKQHSYKDLSGFRKLIIILYFFLQLQDSLKLI